MKRLVVTDVNLCNGCRICEMMCSFFHEKEFSARKARIRVMKVEERGLDVPVVDSTCDLCGGSPVCVEYCRTGALQYSEVLPSETNVLDRLSGRIFKEWRRQE